jgi:hypothetical protein
MNIQNIIEKAEFSEEEYEEFKELCLERKAKLNGLNEQQKEVMIAKWAKEIKAKNPESTNKPKPQEKVYALQKHEIGILERVLNELRNYRTPEVRDEKEFEKGVYSFLTAKFPNFSIERQYPSNRGKVDLVIEKKYAIELKIAESRNQVRSFIGQLKDYHKDFNNIAIVVLDIGKVETLNEYIQDWKQEGIKVLIMHGSVSRKKQPYMQQKFYGR